MAKKNIVLKRPSRSADRITALRGMVPKCPDCGRLLENKYEQAQALCSPCRMAESERSDEDLWCYTFEGRW